MYISKNTTISIKSVFQAKQIFKLSIGFSVFLAIFVHINYISFMTMYTIQTNQSGTRSLNVSEENLQTIEKYSLFQQLIDSNGIIDESVLEKLKLNVRSLIASTEDDCKDLLDLCLNVIYHDNMKAFGLHQLIMLYLKWEKERGNIEI